MSLSFRGLSSQAVDVNVVAVSIIAIVGTSLC